MTDRELLELAAKAAGIDYHATLKDGTKCIHDGRGYWNPIIDDGDAFRLMVDLSLSVSQSSVLVVAERERPEEVGCVEKHGDDRRSATRLAIVRAAAEIGRSMK